MMKTPTMTAILAFAILLHFACGTSLEAQDPKSSQSMQYELALQRGTQAVIWGLPAVSMKFFFEGMQAVGAGYNDIVYFSKPMVSRHGFLTANNNVPYVAVFLNTKAGPVVLDVPAASEKTMYFGSILDMWQTSKSWPSWSMKSTKSPSLPRNTACWHRSASPKGSRSSPMHV
jgi:hypothetical protein